MVLIKLIKIKLFDHEIQIFIIHLMTSKVVIISFDYYIIIKLL